jgi:hypothetical protein
MSSSSEREGRLESLSRKLGYELDEDFRRAGIKLKDILIRDFDKEQRISETQGRLIIKIVICKLHLDKGLIF